MPLRYHNTWMVASQCAWRGACMNKLSCCIAKVMSRWERFRYRKCLTNLLYLVTLENGMPESWMSFNLWAIGTCVVLALDSLAALMMSWMYLFWWIYMPNKKHAISKPRKSLAWPRSLIVNWESRYCLVAIISNSILRVTNTSSTYIIKIKQMRKNLTW